jgi:TP901 family phage tail tape measure protein
VRTIAVDVELIIGADVSASVAQLNEDLNQILSNSSLKTGIKLIDPSNAGSLETIIGQLSEIVELTKQISQKPFMLSLGGATNKDLEYIDLYKNKMVELLSVTRQMQEIAFNSAGTLSFTKALGQDAGAFYTLSQKLDLSAMSAKLASAGSTGEINKATQDLLTYHDVLERVLTRLNAGGVITPQVDSSGYEAAKKAVDDYSQKVTEGVEKTKEILAGGNQPGQQISSDLKIGSAEGGEAFKKLGETIGETLADIRAKIESTFDLSTVDLHAENVREQLNQLVSAAREAKAYTENGAAWSTANQSNQFGALQGVRNYFDTDGNQIKQVVTYYDELNHVTTALTTVRDAEGNLATTMTQTSNAMAQRAQEEHQEQENAKLAAAADQQRVSAIETVITALQKYSGLQGENNAAVRESLSALSAAEAGLRNLELDFQNGTLTAEEYSRGVREITATITPNIGVLSRYSMAMRQQADAARQANAATKERAAAMRQAITVEGQQAMALRTTRQALNDFRAAQTSTKAGSKEAYQTLVNNETVLGRLQGMYKSGKINADGYGRAVKQVSERTKEATFTLKQNGEGFKTLGDRLKETVKRYSSYLLTSRLMFAAIRAVREMIKASIELDSAFAQLQIVTQSTNAEMGEFVDTLTGAAKRVGSSVADLANSATVFARLGYDLNESSTLAEYTTMLSNVANIDVGEAQDAVTAILKAFSDELDVNNIESVMNKLVVVGNNFPISTAQIAEGMNNASSVLAAAGNSFEQSVALLTAANTTVQNASKAATGLRTIAARIRNTSTELDELGEEMTPSKYEEVVKALTDAHVALRDVNGDYRSTYDILKDIADEWDTLSSSRQAALATALAGTRQQAIFYSIINQFKEASEAMSAMEGSAGALDKAYDTILNTAQTKINQFKATFQELSMRIFQSDWIDDVVDAARELIELLSRAAQVISGLVNALGGLKTTLGLIVAMVVRTKFVAALTSVGASLTLIQKLILIGTVGIRGATAALIANSGSLTAATAGMETATLASMTLTGGMGALAKGIASVTAAWLASPFGMITVIVAGLALLNRAIKQEEEAAEEARRKSEERFNEARNQLKTLPEEVKDVGGKIDNIRDRINEINSLGSISLINQKELDRLAESLEMLEREKEIKDQMAREAERDVAEGLKKTKVTNLSLTDEFANLGFNRGGKEYKAGGIPDDIRDLLYLSHTEGEIQDFWDLVNPFRSNSTATRGYELAVSDVVFSPSNLELLDEYFSGEGKEYRARFESLLRKQLAYISETVDGIEFYQDPSTEDQKTIDRELREFYNLQDRILFILSDDKEAAYRSAFSRIMTQYGFDNYSDFEKSKGSDRHTAAFSDLFSLIPDIDSIDTSDDIQRYFDLINDKAKETVEQAQSSAEEIRDLSEVYSELTSALDAANEAEKENAAGNSLSSKTLGTLKGINENYLEYLYEEDGVVKLNTEAWREWAETRYSAQLSAVRTAVESPLEEFKNENKEIYNQITLIKQLADQYNDLSYGNVDYSQRPFVKANELVQKGWGEVNPDLMGSLDDWVTTFTQGFTIGEGENQVTFDISPVLPNGEVLTPDELYDYVDGLITDSGIEGVLKSDTKGLITNIVKGGFDEAYWSEYEAKIDQIKSAHALYFSDAMEEAGIGWEELNKLVAEYSEIAALTAEGAETLDIYVSLLKEAEKTSAGLNKYLSGLNGLSSGLDTLDKLYLDVVNGDSFDFSALTDSNFISTFSQYTEEFQNFISTIQESPEDISACQEAFDALAGAYLRGSKVLADVSDETRDLTIKYLEQKGVANAAALVDAQLAYNKKKLVYETIVCKDMTYAETYALYEECEAGSLTQQVLAQVAIEKALVNDKAINTEADVDQLIALANTARITQSDLERLYQMKEIMSQIDDLHDQAKTRDPLHNEDDNFWAQMIYMPQLLHLRKQYEELASMPVEFEPIDPDLFKVDFTGGSSTNDYYDKQSESAEKAAEKAKTWFDIQLAEHKHRIQMEQETEAQYLAWLDKAYKQAYAEGIHDLDEYRKYEEEVYDGRQKLAESAQSALDKLIDYRKKMLEQEVDDQKDALKEQLDALKDFYDKQKEMLQDANDEEDYIEQQAEKRKSVSDIELKLAQLRGDNSAWAAKRRAELQQELTDAKKELDDFERDHARDAAERLLDDEYAKQEEAINTKIEALEEKYKSAKDLYEAALADIKNGSVELYKEMIAWNADYGDGIDQTITDAWKEAYSALLDYKTLYGSMFGGYHLANATGYVYPSGGYASGTSWAIPGLHRIDEDKAGSETIFESSNGRKYKMFSGGEKVLNARASDFLYRFANGGSQLLEKFVKRVAGGVPEGIGARMQTNAIEMGDIIIQGNADRETISQIRREQRKAVDFMLKEINSLNY